MDKNYQANKAFNEFAKKVGNTYGLGKSKEAIVNIFKDEHIGNFDRAAGYKQAKVLKKIKNITDLGYKTREAISSYGAKKPEPARPKENLEKKTTVSSQKIYSEIMNKGKGNSRDNAGIAIGKKIEEKKSLVQDFRRSNETARTVGQSFNRNSGDNRYDGNHQAQDTGGEKSATIDKLRAIQAK